VTNPDETADDGDQTPARGAAAAKGRRAGRAAKPSSTAPVTTGSSPLAAALRGLVEGMEQEVAEITRLSGEVDEHVSTLNALRADITQRLVHLDELRAVADDANLGAFLDENIQPQLPQEAEDFPERIYGT
jgi:hypothetical protein